MVLLLLCKETDHFTVRELRHKTLVTISAKSSLKCLHNYGFKTHILLFLLHTLISQQGEKIFSPSTEQGYNRAKQTPKPWLRPFFTLV